MLMSIPNKFEDERVCVLILKLLVVNYKIDTHTTHYTSHIKCINLLFKSFFPDMYVMQIL